MGGFIMRCENCGGTNTTERTIKLDYLGSIVQKVPAIICQECGEQMILSDVLEEVSKLIKEGKTAYQ